MYNINGISTVDKRQEYKSKADRRDHYYNMYYCDKNSRGGLK